MITQEELKSFVSYDQLTGVFIWKASTNGRIKVGSFVRFDDAVLARKEAEKELGYCRGNQHA